MEKHYHNLGKQELQRKLLDQLRQECGQSHGNRPDYEPEIWPRVINDFIAITMGRWYPDKR